MAAASCIVTSAITRWRSASRAACRPKEAASSQHSRRGGCYGCWQVHELGKRGQLPGTKLPLPEAKLTKNLPPIPAPLTPVHDPDFFNQVLPIPERRCTLHRDASPGG